MGFLLASLSHFFDDRPIHDEIRYHYSCIEFEATCYSEPKFNGELVMLNLEEPVFIPANQPLPDVTEVIYLRCEAKSKSFKLNPYFPLNIPRAVTNPVRIKINEALRGKVTPDLRQIQFRWIEPEKECLITYIHNGPVTQEVQAHYQEMFDLATSFPWKHQQGLVTPQMEVLSIPYPQPLPQENLEENFYTRKEPFEDPI